MKKLSLKNAEKLLSRKEMKMINGGYGGYGGSGMNCKTNVACTVYDPNSHFTYSGTCQGITGNNITTCYCSTPLGYYESGNANGMSYCTA